MHVVANITNTKGVNGILMEHGQAWRRRSSENVVLVDPGCATVAAAAGLHGSGAAWPDWRHTHD